MIIEVDPLNRHHNRCFLEKTNKINGFLKGWHGVLYGEKLMQFYNDQTGRMPHPNLRTPHAGWVVETVEDMPVALWLKTEPITLKKRKAETRSFSRNCRRKV